MIASAANTTSELIGKTGVKMEGPYAWVPPNYWTHPENIKGGAWGFSTEISPGVAHVPYESLTRFIPENELWPPG